MTPDFTRDKRAGEPGLVVGAAGFGQEADGDRGGQHDDAVRRILRVFLDP
jgi:hypothetical protein